MAGVRRIATILRRKPEPPDAEMIAFCERWAGVWRGLALYARAHEYYTMAERFTTAADDVYERLEAQLP
jgi:hypothetical protein